MNTNLRIMFAPASDFGKVHTVAVHQKLETREDVYSALERAERDLFPAIVFYVAPGVELSIIQEAVSIGSIAAVS